MWTIRPDGSAKRRVGDAFGASLSPSGRTIAYAGDTGASGGLLLIAPAGGKPGKEFRLWAGKEAEGYSPPVWSPDERRVAVEITLTERTLIYRVDLNGRPRRISLVRGRSDSSPAWSPDGRRLAFVRCALGAPVKCYLAVMRPDGTGRRGLVWAFDTYPSEPAWSPDGRRLAYTAAFGPERQLSPRGFGRSIGVYVVGADGSGLRRVAKTRPVDVDAVTTPSRPAWSPDGRRLAFADARGISVVEVGNNRRRRLTWKGADFGRGAFAWSPGPRVVFGHGGWIYTVSEGESPTRVAAYS